MQYTFRDLLNILFRYSRALVIFWVVTTIVLLVFYTQTAKLYDSKARILVTLGSEAQGRADYINGKNVQVVQREQQLHDEQEILQSHDVLITAAGWLLGDKVPETLPVTSEQLDEARNFYAGNAPQATLLLRASSGLGNLFKKSGKEKSHEEKLEEVARGLFDDLSVNAILDSDALDISFRYSDPRVAQTVLRLIIASFYSHHISVFQSSAESELLKTEFDRSVEKYHDQLGQFSTFMNAHKVYDDEFQSNALIDRRGKTQQALDDAVADVDSAAARGGMLKDLQKTVRQFETYSTTEVRNKQRDDLSAKLDQMLLDQQAQLSRHPKGSRADQEQQALLDELHRLINKEAEQLPAQSEQRRSKASELIDSEIIAANEAQRGDQARVDRFSRDRSQLDSEIASYTTALQGYDVLKQDVAFAKRESDQMGQAFVDSQLRTLTSERAITDLALIDLPSLDLRPASPKSLMIAAVGVGLLVLGSFAVILASIGLDTTVTDSKSAEFQLGAPVTASIPLVTGMEGSAAEFLDAFTRENHREFARVYQTIQRGTPEAGTGRVVLLAESNSREGSSLLAYGLARFLSHDVHERTLFIDCSANSILGTSAFARESANEPASLPWPEDAVTADGTHTTAAAAIAKLREQYDYIVIAGGALKEATGILTLGNAVAATLLIVEAGKTRRASARYSLDLLRSYGFNGLGLILNKRIFYVPSWLMRYV